MVNRMVYTERAETAAVSRGTSHITSKQRYNNLYVTSVGIPKTRYKNLQSLILNHTRQGLNESVRTWRIALYKSDQQQQESELKSCVQVEVAASPGLPVPNSPYGLCGRKATLKLEQQQQRSSSLGQRASAFHLR